MQWIFASFSLFVCGTFASETECDFRLYPSPIDFVEPASLKVRDVWLWTDWTHATIAAENVNDCTESDGQFARVFDRDFWCVFHDENGQWIASTVSHSPAKLPYANSVLLDCELPAEITQKTANKKQYAFVANVSLSVNEPSEKRAVSSQPLVVEWCPRLQLAEPTKKYDLSVCTFVNAEPYIDSELWREVEGAHRALRIPEWVEWHLAAGVQHIFIFYLATDSVNFEKLLAPYIFSGVLTLVRWPRVANDVCNKHVFLGAARHKFRGMTHWAMAEASCVGRFAQPSSEWSALVDSSDYLFATSIARILSSAAAHYTSVSFRGRNVLDCVQIGMNDRVPRASVLSNAQCIQRQSDRFRKRQVIRTDGVRLVNQFWALSGWRPLAELHVDDADAFAIYHSQAVDFVHSKQLNRSPLEVATEPTRRYAHALLQMHRQLAARFLHQTTLRIPHFALNNTPPNLYSTQSI